MQLLAGGETFEERRGLQLDADARRSSAGLRGHGRSPSTRTSPESGLRSPSIISSVVVLPAPLGPRIPKNSPSPTSRLTPSTANRSP